MGGRYGYAGAWGYQAAGGEQCGPVGEEFLCDALAELGWLHVGERYYDPSCGRFVQRDPIGIAGGWNVYVYVDNRPNAAIDPAGLSIVIFQWHEGGGSIGHTVAFSTITGKYVSFGPWSNKRQQHDFQDDSNKYGGLCMNMWIVNGLDENAFTERAREYDRPGWDLTFKNCIHAVVNCLEAGGAPAGPFFANPWEARKYFNKL